MSLDTYKSDEGKDKRARNDTIVDIDDVKAHVCALFESIGESFFNEKDNAKVVAIMRQAVDELPEQEDIGEYDEFKKYSIDYIICTLLYTKEDNNEEILATVFLFIERIVKESYLKQSYKLTTVLFIILRRTVITGECFDASLEVILRILSFGKAIREKFFSYVTLLSITNILMHNNMYNEALFIFLKAAPVVNADDQNLILKSTLEILNIQEGEETLMKVMEIISSIPFNVHLFYSSLGEFMDIATTNISNSFSPLFLKQMYEKKIFAINENTADSLVGVITSSDPSDVIVYHATNALYCALKNNPGIISAIEAKGIYRVIVDVYNQSAMKAKIILSQFLTLIINHSSKENLAQFITSDVIDILLDNLSSGADFDVSQILSSLIAIFNVIPNETVTSILDDEHIQSIFDDLINSDKKDVKYKVEAIKSAFL
jgi:hypothetical protein